MLGGQPAVVIGWRNHELGSAENGPLSFHIIECAHPNRSVCRTRRHEHTECSWGLSIGSGVHRESRIGSETHVGLSGCWIDASEEVRPSDYYSRLRRS